MKRKLIFNVAKKILLILFLISFLVVPVDGLVAEIPSLIPNGPTINLPVVPPVVPPVDPAIIEIRPPIQAETFEELITALINFLFTIALIIAPLVIIVGAFYILIPGEDGKNIQTGRKIITYAIIGFIIILLARGMIELLGHIFEIENGQPPINGQLLE